MITVVNKYKHKKTKQDVYIGRGSPLGNPYTSIQSKKTKADFVVNTREEAISNYQKWLSTKMAQNNEEVMNEIYRIRNLAQEGDVNLVCYCKPQACHGDILKNMIEQLVTLNSRWRNG